MESKGERQHLMTKIQTLKNHTFDELAIEVFRYQTKYNYLYKSYIDLLRLNPNTVSSIEEIPFLPISLFKKFQVKTENWESEAIFTSSGTTQTSVSKHHVRSLEWYEEITVKCFEQFYQPVQETCFLALLPAYLERDGSSLVYMVQHFINQSKYVQSGFYLDNMEELALQLKECIRLKIPTVLIGVSFALWDLAEKYPLNLSPVTVMETGGMKGRRKELTRQELHSIFTNAFHSKEIHSEYGMTELLSQAYSKGQGIFYPSTTMKLLCREVNDPFAIMEAGKSGLVNIVDLANLDSCSFIATDDIGKVYSNGSFEILGRLDSSDIRGCNLLVDTY